MGVASGVMYTSQNVVHLVHVVFIDAGTEFDLDLRVLEVCGAWPQLFLQPVHRVLRRCLALDLRHPGRHRQQAQARDALPDSHPGNQGKDASTE